MNYYIIDGLPIQSEIELNETNGYPNATIITAEQYNELLNPTPIEPSEFEVAKASKTAALNQYIASFYSQGFYDATTNYLLFTTEKDVTNYATLKNAIFDMADNTPVEIGTMYGWMSSTKAVIYPLLVRYSEYMLPFTTKVMKAQTALQYSTTVEQIEAITW